MALNITGFKLNYVKIGGILEKSISSNLYNPRLHHGSKHESFTIKFIGAKISGPKLLVFPSLFIILDSYNFFFIYNVSRLLFVFIKFLSIFLM